VNTSYLRQETQVVWFGVSF